MKQTLGMAMTPQLQQAIKILQMSVLELQKEVSDALVENPTLEEDFSGGEDSPSHSENAASENVEPNDALAGTGDNSGDMPEFMDPNLSATNWRSTRNFNVDELPSYEQVLSRPTSLPDHVLWQLKMSTEDPQVLAIGEELIGNLNEDGYLTILLEEVAEKLKVDVSEVEAVLFRIQRFDPPGVAARDLKECLLIQSEILEEDDEVEMIITRHLSELENKNYAAIAKSLDLPIERVVELSRVIHGMEPKPGRSFVTTEPQYFVPDIYVMKVGKEFVVVLNEDGIPKLRISKEYQDQILGGEIKGEAKSYLKDKLKGAAWLLKSIYQRQRTIFRVTEAILARQKEFFEEGPEKLRPMILRQIADELGLHESTISRVTTNKYVHTPHGIFELKYFFNSGIARNDGQDDVASESVKQKIRQFVSGEDPKNPLSDQQLADMLKDSNIQIARRTVAKYREALGVLPSNKRKKYF